MRTSPKDIGELLGQSLENGVCPDDQLPSERDLAEEFAVSRQGIHAALEPLLETGRLPLRHGVMDNILPCKGHVDTGSYANVDSDYIRSR